GAGGAERFFTKIFKYIWENSSEYMLDLEGALSDAIQIEMQKQHKKKISQTRLNLLREAVLSSVATAWTVHVLSPGHTVDSARNSLCLANQIYGMLIGMQFSRFAAMP
ncbi:hypothetical protein, partial [Rugamonas apoptosis]|uniref:hypothetical protein n=1 Tax=Rugamonas apoptosis TaxID=2758570 RepID=UPI001C716C07